MEYFFSKLVRTINKRGGNAKMANKMKIQILDETTFEVLDALEFEIDVGQATLMVDGKILLIEVTK